MDEEAKKLILLYFFLLARTAMAEEKKKTGSSLQKSYFDVLGICCSSEVGLIENILKPLDGIKEISVVVPTRTVIVLHDSMVISQIQIAKALNQARLEANVRLYGEDNYKKKWPSPYAVASGSLLSLSLLKYVYHPLQWLALGAVALGIIPVALKATASIRNFRLDINILIIIAVIGTIALNDYLEAGTIVFLFTIAEWLESRASHKAKAVMSSLMNIAPQNAVIAETGEKVDAGEVKINTTIAVKAGEIIPIDGIVVAGKCDVDEKNLTGESFPVAKQKDSSVWAGTINLNGYVSVKTTALAEDCVVAKMAKLVEEAQNNKSSTQKFIDKCSKFYTPAVIVVSASFAVVPAALRVHNTNHWFHLALVVLVSACPCALILSTPVATFCALTKAAKSGLLIKGGDFLETLAKVKVIAFDKTGTITRGEFVVTDCQVLQSGVDMNMFVYWVTSIESKSSHPLAAALIDYGHSHSVDCKPENVEKFENFPGEGVYGKIDGKEFYVGSRKIATRAGCPTVPSREHVTEGKSIGYVFCEGKLIGKFSLADKCRSGVEEAITEIKSLGIKTAMLTGDSTAAAMHVQQQLRNVLEEVHGELLPEEKAKMIRRYKKEGPTAMVGDGINDAPALATADIGISMGISGSALANETGNVILMSNDIRKVGKAIKIARKCRRKVMENVVLSFITKAAILGLGFAGHPLIWAAVLADVGTCLMVTLNSMLLLKGVDGSSDHHQHRHHRKGNSHCCSKKASVIEKCSGRDEENHCHGKAQKMDSNGGLESGRGGGGSSDQHHHHHHKGNSHCCSKKASVVQKCAGSGEENHCHGKKANKIDNNGGLECCREENGETPDGKIEKHEFEKNPHGNCCSKRVSQQCAEKGEVGKRKHCHEALKMDNNGGLDLLRETNREHPDGKIGRCVQKDAIQTNRSHCCLKSASDPQKCGGNGEGKHCNGRAQKMENNGDLRSSKLENGQNPDEKKGCCVEKEGSKRNYHIPSDSSAEERKRSGNCCHGENSNEILHTAIDMEKLIERERGEDCGRESEESSTSIDACNKSCEKRELGRCCKSYLKECGQKPASFVHGLSEIITE